MLARLVSLALLAFISSPCVSITAQTLNAWINPSSGAWEQNYWSLGELPGQGQWVLLTNAGWKAIEIGPSTVENFPQTLSPALISLASPPGSYNELLLNYFGFQTPLAVQQLIINSNTDLTTLSSALNVHNLMGGAFSIGGTLNQGEYSTVSALNLAIGDIRPGVYNLTNG